MRPKDKRRGDQETGGPGDKENGERASAEAAADGNGPGSAVSDLTDEEALVLNPLKENSPVDLNDPKGQTGLSNKKWDLAIKGLRKHNLAKVEKTDAGLFVELT